MLTIMLLSCIIFATSATSSESVLQGRNQPSSGLNLLKQAEIHRLAHRGQRSRGGKEGATKAYPFVTVSYAQTIDGSIAPLNRTRLDISSKTSFRLLHSLRATHDGVLVGINTVLCDQPRLNVRDPLPGVSMPARQPRSLIIDTELKIADAVDPLQLQRPIVFTCVGEDDEDEDEKGKIDAAGSNSGSNSKSRQGRWARAQAKLEPLGGQLVRVGSIRDNMKTGVAGSGRHCNLEECLEACKTSLDIHSVLVEGGAGIIQTVLQHDLAHQFIVTISPSFFGGYRSMTSQLDFQRALGEVEVEMVEGDVIVRGTMTD